jgi:SAM-dependent methyltransferase
MNEMGKTRSIWGPKELEILKGDGIDIGYGSGPTVMPGARGFDLPDGDANFITRYVKEQYDYVFSSHCLEHMNDVHNALFEWWKLVRPGGSLFLIVPDEDLYEQGYWPSRFNSDHKWTFTISKYRSWSPKSINLLDICLDYRGYKGAESFSIAVQDHRYNRKLIGIDQTLGDALAQIQCVIKKRK